MLKMVKHLNKQIKSELEKADEYAGCALKYKDELDREHLYKTYIKLSTQEIEHAEALLEDMIILVNAYKKVQGELATDVAVLYDFVKEELTDCESKVKVKLEMAKKTTY